MSQRGHLTGIDGPRGTRQTPAETSWTPSRAPETMTPSNLDESALVESELVESACSSDQDGATGVSRAGGGTDEGDGECGGQGSQGNSGPPAQAANTGCKHVVEYLHAHTTCMCVYMVHITCTTHCFHTSVDPPPPCDAHHRRPGC